jgi:hypothetical protein
MEEAKGTEEKIRLKPCCIDLSCNWRHWRSRRPQVPLGSRIGTLTALLAWQLLCSSRGASSVTAQAPTTPGLACPERSAGDGE